MTVRQRKASEQIWDLYINSAATKNQENRTYVNNKEEIKEFYSNLEELWNESCSVMSNSLQHFGLYSPWNSPGQNIEVGSLSLLQGILPTQGLNCGILHCRQILYQLSHKGSPRILEWVAYPFSSGSSRPRNRTGVSCIAGGFFTSWATREALKSCLRHKWYLSSVFLASSFSTILFFLWCNYQNQGEIKAIITVSLVTFCIFKKCTSNYEIIDFFFYYQRSFRCHWGGLERRGEG